MTYFSDINLNSTAKKHLLDLQRSLYQKAYQDACAYAKGTSKVLLAYSSRFEENLPETFHDSSHDHVMSQILKSNVVLFGDFHTLKQSQRGLLRILRSLRNRKRKNKEIIIALEAFKAIDQKSIDLFLDRKIGESEFLKATNYKTDWGFPWSHYKIFLEFARDENIKVVGINSHKSGKDSLKKRDDFAAERIVHLALKNPESIIFCLIGEYHLADEHLPRSLKVTAVKNHVPLNLMRILTNVDKYFFEMNPSKPSMTTEYLYLRDNIFCIMNSPPWMKWQSYTLWEEMRDIDQVDDYFDEGEDEDEFDLYTEQTFDVDYHFLALLKSLVKFLNLQIDEVSLSEFSIHNFIHEDIVEQVVLERKENNFYTRIALERSHLDGFYFLPDRNIILLSQLTINNLTEASGQFLHFQKNKIQENSLDHVHSFYLRVIRNMAGMIAAKILNPRRKCLSLFHFKKFLDNNYKKKLHGHPHDVRMAASLILKHHEWVESIIKKHESKFNAHSKKIYELDLELNYEISRSVGALLGCAVYSKVMTNKLDANDLKEVFDTSLQSFDDVWNLFIKNYRCLF